MGLMATCGSPTTLGLASIGPQHRQGGLPFLPAHTASSGPGLGTTVGPTAPLLLHRVQRSLLGGGFLPPPPGQAWRTDSCFPRRRFRSRLSPLAFGRVVARGLGVTQDLYGDQCALGSRLRSVFSWLAYLCRQGAYNYVRCRLGTQKPKASRGPGMPALVPGLAVFFS